MSPDGQYVYAGSFSSGGVHIYNTATKAQDAVIFPPSNAIDAELSDNGAFLYVGNYPNGNVYRYSGGGAAWTLDTSFDGDGVVTMPVALEGIAVDAAGNVYSTAYPSGKVYKYDAGSGVVSQFIDLFADGFALNGIGLEIGPDNKLYIGTYAAAAGNKLLRYNLDGTPDATLPTPGVFASGLDFAVQVDFKVVPEPATAAVFFAAIAVLPHRSRRRRR